MVAVVDYGVGNLFSLKSSFDAIGERCSIASNADEIRMADRLILPGVGAFGDAVARLRATGLDEVIVDEARRGKPIMGICLGMQLLLDMGYEYGEHSGLGLIAGEIKPISDIIPSGLPIPHIGWNKLMLNGGKHPILKYANDGDFVYFVHSFYAVSPRENIIAYTEYGAELTAAVACDNVYGCQFHPEKSGSVGLSILKAFCEI